jgi:two-component system, sensor histidine kinase
MTTVLVVEDDSDLLFLYHTALSQKGYNVIEAHNSGQALDLLEAPDFIPALLFIDMGMPDAPGTKVINYMRSEQRFDNTRIVVVTANEQYRARVADKNISHFLVKPVTIAQLVDVADELTA